MADKGGPVSEPPPELKSIRQFIQRGNQLRNADPVITYYCYFWSIRQILANNLHQGNLACMTWTGGLMDELERRKEELKDNDLINDDIAAQAYVEDFALRIFDNGARVVEAGKATGKTRDTLLAAACFLELTKNFAEPDQETQQKIKFAKFHAARIWKAVNQGQDPNPNPSMAPDAPAETLVAPPPPPPPPRPSVMDIPDETELSSPELGRAATPKMYPGSPSPRSTAPEVYQEPLRPSYMASQAYPQPLGPSPQAATPRSSTPQTYSPTPQPQTHTPAPQIYTPTSFIDTPPLAPAVHEPSAPSLFSSSMNPTNAMPPEFTPQYHQQHQQYTPPPPPPPPRQALPFPNPFTSNNPSPFPPPVGAPFFAPPPERPQPQQQPRRAPTEEEIAKAQKHAKWAISALDYEDVETAVKEFRLGLQVLGVQ